MQKRTQKKENLEADAESENAEAEADEVEGTCTGTMENDGLETTDRRSR